MKEVDGTEEFLRLDEGIKNCQNRESFQECQAREYVRNGLASCGCIPYQIKNYSRSVSNTVLCMPPGLECYKSVSFSSDKCLLPCKGMNADVSRDERVEEVEKIGKFKRTLDAYKKYYKIEFYNRKKGIQKLFFYCSNEHMICRKLVWQKN